MAQLKLDKDGKVILLFKGDVQLADNLSALLYNIPPQIAYQVVIYRETLISLRLNENPIPQEISIHPKFIDVLEQIVSREEFDINIAIVSINRLDIISKTTKDENKVKQIWISLINKKIDKDFTRSEFTEEHKILLKRAPKEKINILCNYILKLFFDNPNLHGDYYFIALNSIDTFVNENNIQVNIQDLVKPINFSPEEFIKYLSEAKNQYKKYKVNCAYAAIDTYLAGRSSVDIGLCKVVKYISSEFEFKELEKAVEDLYNNNSNVENIMGAFAVYKLLSKEKPLRKRLTEEQIYSFFPGSPINTDRYIDLICMRIAIGNKWVHFSDSCENVLSNPDERTIELVADQIEYFIEYEKLLLLAIRWRNSLIIEVCKKIAKNNFADSVLNLAELLPEFYNIVDALRISDLELLSHLNNSVQSLKMEFNIVTIEKIIPDTKFYNSALQNRNNLTNLILDVAVNYINSKDQETWRSGLEDVQSYSTQLLYILLKNNIITEMPNNAFSSYKNLLIDITKDELKIPLNGTSEWNLFFDKSYKTILSSTLKNIKDTFVTSRQITNKQFIFFEYLFRNSRVFNEHQGDFTRRILTPIVDDNECLDLIISNSSYYSDIIINSGNDKVDFIEQIRSKIENQPFDEKLNSFSKEIDKRLADKIKIIKGRYYTIAKESDVTDKLRQRVEAEGILHFRLGNDIADDVDPEVNVPKTLEVVFKFDGNTFTKNYAEHGWVRLP